MSDGDGARRRMSIDIDDAGDGWEFLHPSTDQPPVDALAAFLSDVLVDWMKQHPKRIIRSTLGLVSNGTTIGIHVWYDEAA